MSGQKQSQTKQSQIEKYFKAKQSETKKTNKSTRIIPEKIVPKNIGTIASIIYKQLTNIIYELSFWMHFFNWHNLGLNEEPVSKYIIWQKLCCNQFNICSQKYNHMNNLRGFFVNWCTYVWLFFWFQTILSGTFLSVLSLNIKHRIKS